MVQHQPGATASRAAALDLGEAVVAAMKAQLHEAAAATIPAIAAEVPSYQELGDREQENLAQAVELALRGLVSVASKAPHVDQVAPLARQLDAAYALGRGEARAGRSVEALLAAYRVGARVSWRELANIAMASGLAAPELVGLAELVFAYIDELSAASVAGHGDELARADRDRQRMLDQLGRDLVSGAPVASLESHAAATMWAAPEHLVAVLVRPEHVRLVLPRVDLATLQVAGDLPGLPRAVDVTALLVPVADASVRSRLVVALADVPAVIGPVRDWRAVRASVLRAARAWQLGLGGQAGGPGDGPGALVDTEGYLAELAVSADPEVLADLRARVLAPLEGLRPAVAARLQETLRSWLLHQGRREDVAADLFVHPQTVRYRMGQVRECFGSALDDPRSVLELTVALAWQPPD